MSIDVLRGFAIFTMLIANLSGSIMAEPHPFALRVIGSFAAPLFILLAGMMVARGVIYQEHGFWYFLVRGLILIVIAALVCDMWIWGVVPFLNMEVLYLIGLALPITAVFLRLAAPSRWLLIAAIFFLTPVLQEAYGYKADVFGYFLPKDQASLIVVMDHFSTFFGIPLLKQWLIDGWFPVFPWLGFAMLGGALADFRWENNTVQRWNHIVVGVSGVVILIVGVLVWLNYPGALYVRLGFSELFYPPTIGYIITALGVMALLFWLVDFLPEWKGFFALRLFGQVSLFLYVFHWIIIEKLIDQFAQHVGIQAYLWWLLALMVSCMLAAYGYRWLLGRVRVRSR